MCPEAIRGSLSLAKSSLSSSDWSLVINYGMKWYSDTSRVRDAAKIMHNSYRIFYYTNLRVKIIRMRVVLYDRRGGLLIKH